MVGDGMKVLRRRWWYSGRARSNNEAFGEAAKCLNFSGGPSIGVGGLTFSVTVPFLSKEVLPFNVKMGGKLPSV